MIASKGQHATTMLNREDVSVICVEYGTPLDLTQLRTCPAYELHLILCSKGKILVGDYVGDFQPGHILLTAPNASCTRISNQNIDSVSSKDMAILFSLHSIERMIQGFPELREFLVTLNMAEYGVEFEAFDINIAKKLFEDVRREDGVEKVIAFIHLLKTLHSWSKKITLSTQSFLPKLTPATETKIDKAIKFITENYHQELSVKQVAKSICMSESSFNRHFQRATNQRFSEFVNRIRVSKACEILRNTDSRISAICFIVGFTTLSNFNRQFLRIKGMTPKAYRDSSRA